MHIIFWDIDGTLLRTDRAGIYAFRQASLEVLGKEETFDTVTTSGMTDCFLAGEAIKNITGRQPHPDEISALLERYESLLPSHLQQRDGHLLPFVTDTLSFIDRQHDFICCLLTGNTRQAALTKLRHFQIDQYFDFAASGFGNHFANRSDLAANAVSALQTQYGQAANRSLFVIGDTPNDITCGKHIGAKTVAVATGKFSQKDLLRYAPWWAIEQLPPPAELVDKLLC